MSRQNSALASLTATYTDTDSEPEEDERFEHDPVSSVEVVEPVEESTAGISSADKPPTEQEQELQEQPMDVEPAIAEEKPKKPALMSQLSKEDLIDMDAIDDYDYYRDSREASDADEESSGKDTKEDKDSTDDRPDSVDPKPNTPESVNDPDQSPSRKKGALPPPSTAPVSAEAQRIVDKMFESKSKRNLDFNKYIQSNKSFRNPSIYEKLIEYCDLDELGTNYPKDVFDPHEWSASSYYDELAKTQKAEMDRREKARRDRVKVEFVAGVVPKKTVPVPLMTSSVSAAAAAAAATAAKLAAAAPLSKEPEKKKSKWDQRV